MLALLQMLLLVLALMLMLSVLLSVLEPEPELLPMVDVIVIVIVIVATWLRWRACGVAVWIWAPRACEWPRWKLGMAKRRVPKLG